MSVLLALAFPFLKHWGLLASPNVNGHDSIVGAVKALLSALNSLPGSAGNAVSRLLVLFPKPSLPLRWGQCHASGTMLGLSKNPRPNPLYSWGNGCYNVCVTKYSTAVQG